MKNLSFIAFLMAILFTITSCDAKIKNPKIESYKVWGNCDMCKKRIEAAVYKNTEAKGVWDKNTKILSVTYDSLKTNVAIILKRVADAGHDNDKFIADMDVYKKLPECCQYTRKEVAQAIVPVAPIIDSVAAPIAKIEKKEPAKLVEEGKVLPIKELKNEPKTTSTVSKVMEIKPQINALLKIYYEISAALIEGNYAAAKSKAIAFESALNQVDMKSMSASEHTFYMPLHEKLANDVKQIRTASNLEGMRANFDSFSTNLFKVVKEFKANDGQAMYYDYCPMKKMYWISKEEEIKNPYYGSAMLDCGSVKETVK